jgi:hypothetical protein
MKKKLSQKERGEVVTKGFLKDYLDSKNYITKDYLDSKNYITKDYLDSKNYITKDYLDSKNYITKDYLDSKDYITREYLEGKDYATRSHVDSIFDYYQSDMKHHIDSLIERQHDYFRAIIETLEGRFERNESKLENLDNRVTRLEPNLGF